MFLWTQHDPLRDFRDMQHQMDQVFRGLFPHLRVDTPKGPAFNIVELAEAYVLQAEVPGLRDEDLEIEASDEGVTVKGSRKVEAPEGYRVHRRERDAQAFSRTFQFESKLDLDKTTARLERGMLTLTLTKQAKEQPRKIAIGKA